MDEQEELNILERAKARIQKGREEELLSTKQTEEFLGVSHMTIRKYVRDGKLKIYKKGLSHINFYKRADVENLKSIREEIHE